MKKWISALLAAVMLFAIAPTAFAAEEFDYDDTLELSFTFEVRKKEGEAPERRDLDIEVRCSSFLEAHERNVKLDGNTLTMYVVVSAEGLAAVPSKKGTVGVSVKAPSSYEKIEPQTESVEVIYPTMDLDYFEDALYDMRYYDDEDVTYSPDVVLLPAKAVALMKKYMSGSDTMSLNFDDMTLVFVGRNLKSMTARSINTLLEEDASKSMKAFLSANGIKSKTSKVVNFDSGAILGGKVGVKVHTTFKKVYVYRYDESGQKLIPITDVEKTSNSITFFVDRLGEYLISSVELDPDEVIFPTSSNKVSSTGGKLSLISLKKEDSASDGASTGKILVGGKKLIGMSEKEETKPVTGKKLVLKK